jgi:hypothetical protein
MYDSMTSIAILSVAILAQAPSRYCSLAAALMEPSVLRPPPYLQSDGRKRRDSIEKREPSTSFPLLLLLWCIPGLPHLSQKERPRAAKLLQGVARVTGAALDSSPVHMEDIWRGGKLNCKLNGRYVAWEVERQDLSPRSRV